VSPAATPTRQHFGLTLAVLAVAALAFALLQTMVAPALPSIQQELGSSTTSVTWVLTVNLLSASIATPILGRLGDMFGKERVLVLVLVVLALGTVVAGLSHTLPMLIAGRAIQGAGGAIFPLAFGIIRDEFPPERVGTGIGLISATFGVGGGGGLVLAGVIVDHLSYRWIFWLALVLIVAAIVATHFFVPESPIKSPARIDWIGAAGLGVGLVCVLVAVSEGNHWGWGSARVIGLIATGFAVLAAWARFERRAPDPMIDMQMLRMRGVWTTNLTALFTGFGMFGAYLLLPQIVQMPAEAGFGFGATATEAGLYLLPSALVMLVAGPLAGALAGRFGGRLPLLAGIVVAAASFVMLAVAHDQPWQIYVASGLNGFGIGLTFAAMATIVVDAVPRSQTGVATGMNTIMRTIGGAMGAQIAASVVAGHIAPSGLPEESGFTAAFAASAVALGLALLAGLLIPRRGRTPPVLPHGHARLGEPRTPAGVASGD
jgi:EmrB/QacA subfamily drug resistance transporter